MPTALYKDAIEPFAEAIDIIKEEGGRPRIARKNQVGPTRTNLNSSVTIRALKSDLPSCHYSKSISAHMIIKNHICITNLSTSISG